MKNITIYSYDTCPYCEQARNLLKDKGIKFNEINLGKTPEKREEISKKTGMNTVPQIFIGDECIGGFAELAALEVCGELDKFIK
ncbi:MAG: glutaredoxin 3 [Bdellovibrionales bacterium RBG_16_40_8]|nr:MAG: glutaredoxin 3 [Bdellovibrionales bacterium RBG_16_40_8]